MPSAAAANGDVDDSVFPAEATTGSAAMADCKTMSPAE